jgi:hypothetical protein
MVKGLTLGTVTLVGVLGAANQAWAPTAVERTVFGMIGVAAGQTLQLNVVAFPPTPCAATLEFVDANGTAVGPAPRPVALRLGEAASLSVSSQALGVPVGRRVQVRPVVTPDPLVGGGGCVASAELVDQASRFTTVFVEAGSPVLTPPGPADRFGMIGLAPFQTLRLSVVAYPPNPCAATLGFADATGAAVGPSERVGLEPGFATSLDLPRQAIPPGPADRAEVRPVVTLDPLTPGNCVATAESFDVFTGRTWAFIPPGPSD